MQPHSNDSLRNGFVDGVGDGTEGPADGSNNGPADSLRDDPVHGSGDESGACSEVASARAAMLEHAHVPII